MAHSHSWGYSKENGPDKWWSVAPGALGKHQSPVDIEPSAAVFDPTLQNNPLQIHYIPGSCRKLLNTGHGVQIVCDETSAQFIRSWIGGGPYKHKYRLEQFHFHWGKRNSEGSEHTVDGKAFSAELHLVHWNTGLYKSFGEASKSSDGLGVLCVFLQVGKENKYFQKITDLISSISFAGEERIVKGGFDPACLLPENRAAYFTYPGSLTTPPCYESVQFLVFRDPIEISESQMETFRKLYSVKKDSAVPSDEFKGKMLANFRPVQELNDRKILKSFLN